MERTPSADDMRERAELARARRLIEGQLAERGVIVRADDGGEALEELLSAVQHFERERARLGGDSFTNSLLSSDPDDPTLVLPRRENGESAADYAARVRRAAERLARGD
jgi:hypothetical protein